MITFPGPMLRFGEKICPKIDQKYWRFEQKIHHIMQTNIHNFVFKKIASIYIFLYVLMGMYSFAISNEQKFVVSMQVFERLILAIVSI
jgi:hypothetical protein